MKMKFLMTAAVAALIGMAAPAVEAYAPPVAAPATVGWLTDAQTAALIYLADQKTAGNDTLMSDFLVAAVPTLLFAEFHGLIAGGYIRYTAPSTTPGYPDLVTITVAGVVRSHQTNP
jgi:hypothetical protein